jgi:hypothetical protein
MSFKKSAIKFLAETIVGNVLSSAGQQIGEAIGRRVGARIYTPPKDEPRAGAEK